MNKSKTPLSKNSVIRTRNFHEVESFVEGGLRANIIGFPSKPHAFDLQANHYTLKSTDIWFCSYGVPVIIQFPEADYFRIQLHHKGQGATRIGRHEFEISPHQAVISTAPAKIEFGQNFEQKVLRLNRISLAQKITAITGIPLIRPLEFEAAFDTRTPKFKLFQQTFDFIESIIDSSQFEIPALILAELEQTLLASILCSFSNNYSDILNRQSAKIAPWQVCRVEEYIEAHWNQPILIENIVAISGCSARSIFRAFQQHRGYSPMAFAKKIRLQHARKMLLNSEEKTVTRVALACGFADLGRFSRDYAEAFGELPSRTFSHIKYKLATIT